MPHAKDMHYHLPHFRHAFAGELYASGYYTYMWADVLDNDGFDVFNEADDSFDPELAQKCYGNVF